MNSPQDRSIPVEDGQNVAAGIGLMLFAVLVYSVNDALGKWLAGTYSVGQILMFRSLAALIVLAPLIVRTPPQSFVKVERPGLQLLRVACSTGEIACFYGAVAYLPLADTITYYLAAPIFVTVLAAIVLREHVGWRRWSAVLVGFGGVFLAMRPSAESLSWPALIALSGSFLFAVLMIVTRSLRRTGDTVMATWQMGGSLLFGLAVTPFTWVPMAPADIAVTALVGAIAMVAVVAVNRSLRLADASIVVPFQYSMIVWAAVFGYVFFAEVPTPHVVLGATVIIAAGLFIFFREKAVMQRPRKALVGDR